VPIAVIPDDDPWKLVLGRALNSLTGKIASVDVWYLLGLDPYERSMQEQRRLTEVMRVLGWRRKIIRHNAQRARTSHFPRQERHAARYTPEGGFLMRRDAIGRDAGRDPRRRWGAETDASACYLAAAANGCAAAAGRFSLRNPRTCRSAIWICLGFAFHGYRVTWAFGAR